MASAVDLLPPRWRYGYVQPVLRRLWAPVRLPILPGPSSPGGREMAPGSPAVETADIVCVLASDRLDIGGIGSVVEMLALALPAEGVRPVVVCHGDGERARRMRALGVDVVSVTDFDSARRALSAIAPDVIQWHSASPSLEQAARKHDAPLVTVLHNTEIHYDRRRWRQFRELAARSARVVAVSEVVRDFHARRTDATEHAKFVVVPNGAPPSPAVSADERARARRMVEAALATSLGGSMLYLSLARYDAQKNITGMVAAFLAAVERAPDMDVRLVVAGEPSDPLEVKRADAVRRASPRADRVHLLANSDARTLIQAADAFLLDSFFEGWPVAATEAVAGGLPLVISDVGGARELVAADDRSVLIPNAAGVADMVDDRMVARLRRRSRSQPNAAALGEAVRQQYLRHRGLGERAHADIARPGGFSAADMAAAHGRLLRDVVRAPHAHLSRQG